MMQCDNCFNGISTKYHWLQLSEWEKIDTPEGGTFIRKMMLFCSYACAGHYIMGNYVLPDDDEDDMSEKSNVVT